jgi:hypothetical protein
VTKRLVKMPKLYFLDTGLCAYLTEWSRPQTLSAGAMSGAILETHVLCELLKSWWHRGKMPQIYYYRDKDGNEIDFLFVQDQAFYPIEVKKSASPKPKMAGPFASLGRLEHRTAEGAVVCLCEQVVPLNRSVDAVPAGIV